MLRNLYIGLMSGTSVDGIDCVLTAFNSANRPELISASTTPIDSALREQILALCDGNNAGKNINLATYGSTDIAIGKSFADAVHAMLAQTGTAAGEVVAIGSHGQTVYHQPEGDNPFSLQLGDPNTIAQLTGITTVADMRRRDIAAGGQGAPLAPLLHRNVFAADGEGRVVVNLGGIANITLLKANGECLAFDSGPGNVLMDYWIGKQKGEQFDKNGAWAASGTANSALLDALLDEPYFERGHPKSTGRELFNSSWLEARLSAASSATVKAEDVQATLLELSAVTVVKAIKALVSARAVYICGGGAHNGAMMERLQALLPDANVTSTAELGLDPDWVEATAFAWMAQETVAGRKVDTRAFTGAQEPVFLGGIYRAG